MMEPIAVQLMPCALCSGERYVVAVTGGKTTEVNVSKAEVEAGLMQIDGVPVVARVNGSSSLCGQCLEGLVHQNYESIVDRGVAEGQIERWADVVAARK